MKLKYVIAMAVLSLAVTLGPILLWRRAPGSVRKFFTEEASPFPLGLFRIVFFSFCLLAFDSNTAVRFSQLPADLLFPPTGLEWLLQMVPIREMDTRLVVFAQSIFLFLSAIGLWTRISVAASLITSLWVYGIPEFYGKIDHYHHLVWFMAVFAVSPCGDVLSVDSLRRAISRADQGVISLPASSILYSLPLRVFWLLMGIVYFQAGFWKAWTGRLEWAFSDNLRFIMYNKWWELQWLPSFRIDHYPLLYQAAAALTIAWEMAFIILIFYPASRYLAMFAGLVFHNGTAVFMGISFYFLQVCYLCLPDWDVIWRRLGVYMFPETIQVAFDGNCGWCRRTVAMFQTLDVFHRVNYLNALNTEAMLPGPLGLIPSERLLRDIHAADQDQIWTGYNVYRQISLRIPWLWPAVPFLYLPPVRALGTRIYRRVADSRTCPNLPSTLVRDGALTAGGYRWQTIAAVGYILCVSVALSSVAKFHSWPITAYPTFEDIERPEVTALTIEVAMPSGEIKQVQPQKLYAKIGLESHRLLGLTWRILSLSPSPEKERRLCALWREVARSTDLPVGAPLSFYSEIVGTNPEDWGKPPIRREIIGAVAGCLP